MKLLIDENISGSVPSTLAAAGYDVVAIREVQPGSKDIVVLHKALAEQRILVTQDLGFAQLAIRDREKHRGIIQLRGVPTSMQFSAIVDMLNTYGDLLQQGWIGIVDGVWMRIRPPELFES